MAVGKAARGGPRVDPMKVLLSWEPRRTGSRGLPTRPAGRACASPFAASAARATPSKYYFDGNPGAGGAAFGRAAL